MSVLPSTAFTDFWVGLVIACFTHQYAYGVKLRCTSSPTTHLALLFSSYFFFPFSFFFPVRRGTFLPTPVSGARDDHRGS
jgi:hypothetical protein